MVENCSHSQPALKTKCTPSTRSTWSFLQRPRFRRHWRQAAFASPSGSRESSTWFLWKMRMKTIECFESCSWNSYAIKNAIVILMMMITMTTVDRHTKQLKPNRQNTTRNWRTRISSVKCTKTTERRRRRMKQQDFKSSYYTRCDTIKIHYQARKLSSWGRIKITQAYDNNVIIEVSISNRETANPLRIGPHQVTTIRIRTSPSTWTGKEVVLEKVSTAQCRDVHNTSRCDKTTD